ncbi:MAG TPA: M20 aminoacylase family protein [Acetobacteraceae bacterium]|nr:M20 aminoacylase family protein [Acetobacteraceae bacterium]
MSLIDRIRNYHDELTGIRQDIHAHPELGLEEHRTADLVARKLEEWGIEVHRGVGTTGVVGVLRSGNGEGAIGLRADMDALPIQEANDVPYRSRTPGTMHACGHDGHTTMLLGAARYLAETRNFNGTVTFIFQPGEEGVGGALAMLQDGLFQRFPCNTIYGMHNRPGMPIGRFGITPGIAMAGGGFFDITITGKGAHGARPEQSIDPVLVACNIGSALQSIVARNVSPREMAVLSVTRMLSGDAYNVIPQTATMGGTVRVMKREIMAQVEENMRRIVAGVASAFGATAEVDFRTIFAPLVNQETAFNAIADAAAELVGDASVNRAQAPAQASEDFAFMLEQVPGAYINLGNGDCAPVHNHHYDFNDQAIPFGSALFARLIERELPRGSGNA